MKKFKLLLLVFTLFLSLGYINVNAETGKTPGIITTKEDLLYYIYYYGGTAKISGNTIKLTKSLESNNKIIFNNEENIVLDLNGNSIYFTSEVDGGIILYSNSKDFTITDTSNTNKDYIRAQKGITIYNNSRINKLKIENTTIVADSTSPAVYNYGTNTINIDNSTIKAEKTGVSAGAEGTMNIKNSNITLGNPTATNGISVSNAKVTIENTNITLSKTSSSGIAIETSGKDSELIIKSGTFNAKLNAIYIKDGKATINGGTFESETSHAARISKTATINGGEFITKQAAGIQIMGDANVTLNELKTKTSSTSTLGGITIPMNTKIETYIPSTSIINNNQTETKSGMTYTTAKEIIISSLPKTKKLNTTTYNYNGSVRVPTVTVTNGLGKKLINNTDYKITYQSGRKNVGKYYVQITYLGKYSNLKPEKLYFTINPKANKISKITRGKKQMTVKVSKMRTQTTGYQIQYSTNKKFNSAKTYKISNKTTTKKIKKLKAKKKYYVRVRTYKVVNKTTYYSNWSSAKSIYIK